MIAQETLLKAYRLMCMAKSMADTYENNRSVCKYVHSTSRGHEAIQLATAFQLQPFDFVSPYYRDESILLGLGFTPYQLMLQLLAKENIMHILITKAVMRQLLFTKAALRVCRPYQQLALHKA
jgi:2-oxoisovalerate dehydrogenase E1 component